MKLRSVIHSSPFLAIALWGSLASAQPRDSAAADAAFNRGRTAMTKGDFVAACTAFGESYRLDPAVGTQLNLSLCEEKQGKLVAAQTNLSEVLGRLPKGDSRVTVAETRLEALKKRIPTVTVTLDDPNAGAQVNRDGADAGPDSIGRPVPLDPGAHVFVVSAAGRPGSRRDVVLKEGEHVSLTLIVGAPATAGSALPPAPAAASAPEATAPAESKPASGRRIFGIGALAVGGVGIATGIVTGIMTGGAASTYDEHCKNKVCDPDGASAASRGKTLELVSPIAFGVGAIGAGLGAYLLLTSKSPSSRASVTVAPQVSSRDAGFSLVGTF